MAYGECNKIAIYGSRRQLPYLKELEGLFSFLDKQGFLVYLHSSFAGYLEAEGVNTATSVPVDHVPPGVSLIISIGGDGTFLRAARWGGDREIPILGVNTGHLGYLSACGLTDIGDMLDEICRGEVDIEKRMLLKVTSEGLPGNIWPYCLNEVAVRRDESASVISVKAFVDDIQLADYVADGLIISTPTGSTAYNLSAGGPILQPGVDCVALTPIAPHTLTLRPLVMKGESVFDLKVESRSGKYRLSLDDRAYTLNDKLIVRVERAPFNVILIKRKGTNFATPLQEKLLWNASTI